MSVGEVEQEVDRRLRETQGCLDSFLFALEKAALDLDLQPTLMRLVAREFLSTFASIQGSPLILPGSGGLEAAMALRDWYLQIQIFREENHTLRATDRGIWVTVDGHCAHALRCREQMSRGFVVACQRSMEYEDALNRGLGPPTVVREHRLDPGNLCSFLLVPVGSLSSSEHAQG